ncbi:hypothetical protein LBMAG53_08650 [Planctomycetota bacterium]|nr:hypothetical protein LBMAG53_08650 [Planctomycetota bacterium]
MSEPLFLPAVHQGLIDTDRVAQLFADLATTRILSIRIRGGAMRTASSHVSTLSEAQAALMAVPPRAVQIRYRHAGENWCDVLIPGPDGVRLTRISDAEVQRSAESDR